ncbi:DUF1062 domain-containing protein [Brucella tritici]|uniref:DUF1062 domain-containing protein n=1 Tax=Brucella tritici TaxID=94626 RepID=UPI002E271E22
MYLFENRPKPVDVAKAVVHAAAFFETIEIELQVALPVYMRLDRLLATELKISRTRLQVLSDGGTIRMTSDENDVVMRRRIKTGGVISIKPEPSDQEIDWQSLVAGNAC